MLQVTDIETFYGQSQVLFGMSLEIRAGEVVTLMGRNGMGKTTTIRSIMGIAPARAGRITLNGKDITRLPSYGIAQLGLGLVPEGRMIFPNLTVLENLVAAAANYGGRAEPWTVDKVLQLFPSLAARRRNMGNQLSGGEQQMLAIGRALMINPNLLILDEATEGLAPLIRDEIWRILGELKRTGQSILVVDKNIDALTRIAERHYIIEKGRVVWTGSSEDLTRDAETAHRYLGV
jgi:branched-chain amino acid transport system ATP-binding protein